jgi:hypothetical protein
VIRFVINHSTADNRGSRVDHHVRRRAATCGDVQQRAATCSNVRRRAATVDYDSES